MGWGWTYGTGMNSWDEGEPIEGTCGMGINPWDGDAPMGWRCTHRMGMHPLRVTAGGTFPSCSWHKDQRVARAHPPHRAHPGERAQGREGTAALGVGT